ncbi:hypothetical protein BX666DRAFT_2028794 [Dichotomocladium elegans]|nr:hypothetical protein BX666DRAFT_2028794 [Dichotomocladium elegans]
MFMRLLILEDRHAVWIKVVGIALILLRFTDWPYELTFQQVQQSITQQNPLPGDTCWVSWGGGVLILNFVSDSLANLFLSGMFVRRLYIHVQHTKTIMSRQHQLIEYIARKSLVCLIFTFVVNLAMNLLKITNYLGDRSDAFTVYFQLIESTLLVEALRVESRSSDRPIKAICENCGMVLETLPHSEEPQKSQQQQQGSRPFGRTSKPSTNPTESVLQEMAMFDTDSYIEDTKPSTRHPAPGSNDILLQSPMPTIAPRASTPSTMTFASSSPRRPSAQQPQYLTQHPEWSNNDYRMF